MLEMDAGQLQSSGIAPETDDPGIPSFTFRVLILGTIWCIFLGSINSIFTFRTTPFTIPAFLAVLLSYPMGVLAHKMLPRTHFEWLGIRFAMNPGAFSVKEHVLITVIASSGAYVAYGIDNVVAQKSSLFMGHESITFMQGLMWVLVTQSIVTDK
jgi:hypothetical protein